MTTRLKLFTGPVLGAALAGLLAAAPVSAQEVKQDNPEVRQDRQQPRADRAPRKQAAKPVNADQQAGSPDGAKADGKTLASAKRQDKRQKAATPPQAQ